MRSCGRLFKWLLIIPHVVVLFFLWLAVTVLTIVAGFAILFTGRYPRATRSSSSTWPHRAGSGRPTRIAASPDSQPLVTRGPRPRRTDR